MRSRFHTHSFCSRSFPFNSHPVRKPMGSKTDITVDMTVLFVAASGGSCIRYVSMSRFGFHTTPRAL